MNKNEKDVLRCSNCRDEVEKCVQCGKKFKDADVILCYTYEGEHLHFCSIKCMNKYSYPFILNTKLTKTAICRKDKKVDAYGNS